MTHGHVETGESVKEPPTEPRDQCQHDQCLMTPTDGTSAFAERVTLTNHEHSITDDSHQRHAEQNREKREICCFGEPDP